jgi:hypothetical protein
MAIWAKSTQKMVNVKSFYGLGKTTILGLKSNGLLLCKIKSWWPKFGGPRIFFNAMLNKWVVKSWDLGT